MRRLTSIAALLLMLVMMLPVLACAAAPKTTRTEQDCCQQMRGMCGQMAKQGCCRMEVRNDSSQLPAPIVATPVLPLTTIAIFHPLVDRPLSAGYRWHVPDEHSPPGLLIAASTVLRI